jgi:hypothetical protein
MVAVDRTAEVLRILERYLVEIVERYELCPWARSAREHGELAIAILWGTPALDGWIAEGERLLAQPGTGATHVAMVVAPELAISREAFGALRDRVAARLPSAGVADFHPDAALDLATPARLVPFVRRSPDAMLQLVPLAVIDAIRAAPPLADRAQQAGMLGGLAAPPRAELTARIAAANHATLTRAHAAIAAAIDDIAADRAAAYARAGLRSSR